MKWNHLLLIGCLLWSGFWRPAPAAVARQAWQTLEARPNALLVGFKDDYNHRLMRPVIPKDLPARVEGTLPALGVASLSVPSDQFAEVLSQLQNDPRVEFVELDYVARAAELDRAAPAQIGATSSMTDIIPNDPKFSEQWALAQIGAPQAWQVTTGTQNLVIAIVDSGIQLTHPDLSSKRWINSNEVADNGLDDDQNGQIDDVYGWHFFHTWQAGAYNPGEDNQVADNFGHGSHVAGIAAAATNNKVGVAGVAWGASLLPVKVLDQYGIGFYSDIAAGIIYAADRGARIINLSLGSSNASQTLQLAVDYARYKGALVVAAAGNSGQEVFYPAAYPPVVAVTATDAADGVPSYANYGASIDLAAPGNNILSCGYRSNYIKESGTSMATPYVTGAAALLWSRFPQATAEQIVETLVNSGDELIQPRGDIASLKRLNVARALRSSDPSQLRTERIVLPYLTFRWR